MLGNASFQIRKKLQKLFTDNLTSCIIKILFKSPVRVKTFFIFKDKLPKILVSRLVYKYKCGGCNTTYSGNIKRHFNVRICEHLGISHLTGKKLKIDNNKLTAIQEYRLSYNYSPSFEGFSILTRESNDFKLKIMESLLIASNKVVLNKVHFSLPLELFWYASVVIIWFLITSYDVHLSHCAYTIVVFSVFNITLRVFEFYQKTECMSIKYYFKRDHENSDFWKVAGNLLF